MLFKTHALLATLTMQLSTVVLAQQVVHRPLAQQPAQPRSQAIVARSVMPSARPALVSPAPKITMPVRTVIRKGATGNVPVPPEQFRLYMARERAAGRMQ